LAAIADADGSRMGPGSWFSSVIPHLLVPAQLQALQEFSGAKDFDFESVMLRVNLKVKSSQDLNP